MKSTIKNSRINTLIAEDNRTQAEQLSLLLEKQGYRVAVAANGKLALHVAQTGVEINLGGEKYSINAESQQILDLLISTYEQAMHINNDFKQSQKELDNSNQVLNGLYKIAEGLIQVRSEREVAEFALERVMELPGVRGGWVCILDGDSSFKTVATLNLPPALTAPGAMDGDCACRRRLVSGKRNTASNVLECERMANALGGTDEAFNHATVPLWIGERTVGLMNLIGANQGTFDKSELKVLHGVGNLLAVAMERARLHGHLEQLVDERTAELRLFRTLLDNSTDTILMIDYDTMRFLDVNDTGCSALGYSREELLSMSVFDVDSVLSVDTMKIHKAKLQESKHAWLESVGRRKDGSVFPVEISLTFNELDKPYLLAIVRDITHRKENEARIMRLNRIYAVLSGINTTIVHVRDEDELFRKSCQIAVEQGEFVFAWIGKLDANAQQVTPHAQSGDGDDYLAKINLSTNEDTPGSCVLTAQTLTGGVPVICNDIASDTRMLSLRSDALSHGYRSVILLPLILQGKPVGIFVLYASEPGVFDNDEIKLLVEMSEDISFAMDYFNQEAERKLAELKLSEQFEELSRWHKTTLGRELRTLELKREVNELLAQAGQPPRYSSVAQ